MADACIADTDTIDLAFVGSDLTGNVRKKSLATGGIDSDANGLGVTLHPSGGLQHSASGIGQKLQGNNWGANVNGIQFSNAYGYIGWGIGTDDTVLHGTAVPVGGVAAVGGVLTASMTSVGSGVQYYLVESNWEGQYQTTYNEFQTSNIFDSVYVYLQRNFDSTGWITLDWQSLNTFRQAQSFRLNCLEVVGLGDNVAHSYQTRLIYAGGSSSGTAQQGTIQSSYRRRIQLWW